MRLPRIHPGLALVVLVALGLGIAMGQAIPPEPLTFPTEGPAAIDQAADLEAARQLVAQEAARRQQAATEEINQVLRKHRCSIGAVVVIQPQTQ